MNGARIQELAERSMRRAEESLRRLIRHPIRLRVCRVGAFSLEGASAWTEIAEGGPALGIRFEITGQGSGHIFILFPQGMVHRILQTLLGGDARTRPLTDVEISAIQEVGNIMASSFLSEWGDSLGRRLLHSVPQARSEDILRWMRDALASLCALGTELIEVRGVLEDGERRIHGRFFVVSEIATPENFGDGGRKNRR